MNDFAEEFTMAWPHITSRFLKLECWQTYQEQEWNRSHDAFKLGDVRSATELLRKEAETSRPIYEGIESRGLDYARVRLVTLPLTPYLEYEVINYKIRHELGENIEFALFPPETPLPNDEFFDFLLFDDELALVHDYGTDGFQVGGWLVEEPAVVRRLEKIVVTIRRKTVTLEEFLRAVTV